MSLASAEIEPGQIRLAGRVVAAEITRVEGGIDMVFADEFARGGLLEIDFASIIYRQRTPFAAFLANGQGDQQISQQVDEGDAHADIASERVAVSLPVVSTLVGELELSEALLTPNGDGITDRLRIDFALLNVLEPRGVRVALYDLSGRQIRILHDEPKKAGPMALEWDGLDDGGWQAPPGHYILRIEVQGDTGTKRLTRLIGLVF